jgi:hypothetical protein
MLSFSHKNSVPDIFDQPSYLLMMIFWVMTPCPHLARTQKNITIIVTAVKSSNLNIFIYWETSTWKTEKEMDNISTNAGEIGCEGGGEGN